MCYYFSRCALRDRIPVNVYVFLNARQRTINFSECCFQRKSSRGTFFSPRAVRRRRFSSRCSCRRRRLCLFLPQLTKG